MERERYEAVVLWSGSAMERERYGAGVGVQRNEIQGRLRARRILKSPNKRLENFANSRTARLRLLAVKKLKASKAGKTMRKAFLLI